MPRQPHLADCSLCEWDQLMADADLAKMVSVLHVLVKHPEDYRRATGNDPDKKKYEYREQIEAYRRYL